MAATATPATLTSKACPGVISLGMPAHEAPATTEAFNVNVQLKDGLSVRCRTCGNAYGKAWREAKARGEKFSAKAPQPEPMQEPATGAPVPVPAARGPRKQALRGPDGSEVFVGKAAQVAERVATEPRPLRTFADELAERVTRGLVDGYTTEVVGGLTYALPDGSAASTPEGQAALATVNAAKAAERRKRDADRKRAERAAKKAAAATV